MRGRRLVVDTSVIIQWYRQNEMHAEAALAIRGAYLAGNMQLLAPDLALTEFANVMRYMKDFSVEQVQQAVTSLFAMRLTWLTPTSAVLQRAVAITTVGAFYRANGWHVGQPQVLHSGRWRLRQLRRFRVWVGGIRPRDTDGDRHRCGDRHRGGGPL